VKEIPKTEHDPNARTTRVALKNYAAVFCIQQPQATVILGEGERTTGRMQNPGAQHRNQPWFKEKV